MKKAGLLTAILSFLMIHSVCQPITWKQSLSQSPQWYKSPEAARIADNVLLYQRNNGGWPKNTEMAQPLSDTEVANLIKDKRLDDSTIDNGATYRQMRYLARIYKATDIDKYKTAFLKGIDYLLEAQYPNGGWPQFYPHKRGYYTHITFNDGAMINVMNLLSSIEKADPLYDFINQSYRIKCSQALQKGIDCILKCQIVEDGKKLAWCAQHDEVTFAPRPARSYERESLSGSEAVGVVEFLMQIENPSPQIIESIQSAVKWFDSVKIHGIRIGRIPAANTPRGYDKVVVNDSTAPAVWARFYQIGTNRPIFCSRDGIIRYNLSEISYERRNGYSWYTSAPADLLSKKYPAWQKRWAPDRNVLKQE